MKSGVAVWRHLPRRDGMRSARLLTRAVRLGEGKGEDAGEGEGEGEIGRAPDSRQRAEGSHVAALTRHQSLRGHSRHLERVWSWDVLSTELPLFLDTFSIHVLGAGAISM